MGVRPSLSGWRCVPAAGSTVTSTGGLEFTDRRTGTPSSDRPFFLSAPSRLSLKTKTSTSAPISTSTEISALSRERCRSRMACTSTIFEMPSLLARAGLSARERDAGRGLGHRRAGVGAPLDARWGGAAAPAPLHRRLALRPIEVRRLRTRGGSGSSSGRAWVISGRDARAATVASRCFTYAAAGHHGARGQLVAAARRGARAVVFIGLEI